MLYVKMGKYKDYIGPYQIAEALCFWAKPVTDEDGFKSKPDFVHDFGTWLVGNGEQDSRLQKVCEWINHYRKPKIIVKIGDQATWNMFTTLAIIILPMLKQLKATKIGSPMVGKHFDQVSNSSQGSFKFYAEGDNSAWDAGHKAWSDILDEMIWAFEQLQPDFDGYTQFYKGESEIDFAKYPEDEGKSNIPLRWKKKSEIDLEGLRAYDLRIISV